MAQAGYTPLSLYHSTTVSAVPTNTNLANGELAINITDGKLFYKDNTNTVQVIGWKTVPISAGGTGQTTASAAFNALSPITSTGDLIIGNGVNSATRLAIGSNGTVLQSNGTTASWVSFTSGASLSNDTSTASNLYPLFANATSGTPSTIFTSNAKLLYKPSTGELQASQLVASNGLILNSTTVSTSYTVAAGTNAMSVGPITIASGQSVTVSSGQRWVVI